MWNQRAKWIAIGVAAGSPLYLLVTFTFGLISGLIVVMAPMFPVLLLVAFTACLVSLCLARQRYVLATIMGVLVSVVPTILPIIWYAAEWRKCTQLPSPEECFDYLNGSPLLLIGVGAMLAVGLCCAAMVVVVVHQEQKRIAAADKAP